MTEPEFIATDFRIIEISHKKLFQRTIFLQFTQLEVLKIRKALLKTKNKDLSIKIEKFIKEIDNETQTITDFDRVLPRKTNGSRVKQWQDLEHFQIVD